tara:strand:+ start:55 stop:354 length:300 start_codon:yes stop_codon:yes gene_type:complete
MKTKSNIRNTRYGEGYTSAEASLLVAASISGLNYEDLTVMTNDAGVKQINERTFELNQSKIDTLLLSLSERHISVEEFKDEIKGEIERTKTSIEPMILE